MTHSRTCTHAKRDAHFLRALTNHASNGISKLCLLHVLQQRHIFKKVFIKRPFNTRTFLHKDRCCGHHICQCGYQSLYSILTSLLSPHRLSWDYRRPLAGFNFFTRYLGYAFFKLIAIIIIKRSRTLKPQLASLLTRKKKATIFTKLHTSAFLHFTNWSRFQLVNCFEGFILESRDMF